MEEPSSEDIARWKSEFGEVFSIGGFIFRPLKVSEHKTLIQHKEWDPAESEDYIVDAALLYPEFSDLETKAGLISSLAEEILNISCYGSDISFAINAMNQARSSVDQVINLMKVFIIAGMPAYSDESLDGYNFFQLANKVAMAEKIINVRQGGVSLELVDPAEEAEKEKERMVRELATKKAGQATSTDPIAQKLRSGLPQ